MGEPDNRADHGLPEQAAGDSAPAGRSALMRWVPLIAITLFLALGYAFGLHHYFSLEALQAYRQSLKSFVAENALATAAAYVAVYVTAVAVSFPGASFLTIVGGFMFGPVAGTFLAAAAATAGATLIFIIARTSLGNLLAERAGPRMQRLSKGFREEGFSYLLFLRLVPLFPFWLVNLAAALFGMRLVAYVLATAIGILPATFVFAYFGQGLESALESGGPRVPTELVIALVLLGVLALVPAFVRRWRRTREKAQGAAR